MKDKNVVCEYKKKCTSYDKANCKICANNTGKRDYFEPLSQNPWIYGNTVSGATSGITLTRG